MRFSTRVIGAAGLGLAALALLVGRSALYGADPATAPAARSASATLQDAIQARGDLLKLVSDPDVYTDAAKRAPALTAALPLLHRMDQDADALAVDTRFARVKWQIQMDIYPIQAALGDADMTAKLQTMAASPSAATATYGKGLQARADFLKAGADGAAQHKALDVFDGLVKADPDNDYLAQMLAIMHENNLATKDSIQQIETIASAIRSDTGKQMTEEWAAHRKLMAMENKPLQFKGVELGGKEFSTDEFKGKVILVDFWASWCGPCIHELPRVTKLYQEYHGKGLEMVGVSCDNSADALKNFLAAHKDMTWPQLFDASNPGWNPLAKQYGIDAIPVMFLIDKKGVLRTVDARENMETMIPKLLAE